jgi:hypothetical protein
MVEDIRLFTERGLIKRYDRYDGTNLQTVTGILNYEQLRGEKNSERDSRSDLRAGTLQALRQTVPHPS